MPGGMGGGEKAEVGGLQKSLLEVPGSAAGGGNGSKTGIT